MKHHLYYCTFSLLLVITCVAAQPKLASWGTPTNNVAMSITARSGSSTFSLDEIRDLSRFIDRLRRQSDGLSEFLWKSFSSDEQSSLLAFDPGISRVSQGLDTVVHALNRIIAGSCIYNAERFNGISIGPETMAVLKGDRLADLVGAPPGPIITRLNRLLLEDAYAAELSKQFPTGKATIKSNDAVILTIMFTNMSINATYYIVNAHQIENDPRYGFQILTPSGIQIAAKARYTPLGASQGYSLNSTNRSRMFNFYLSNIYKFEEVGTYTITANRLVDLPGEKQAQFSVGSNPLTIDIVPDK